MRLKIGFKSEIALINSILISKFFFMFFAVYVFSRITTLGDTNRYLSSGLYFKLNSTSLMDMTGYFAGKIPNPFSHAPMMLLAFIGIRYLVLTLSRFNLCNTYRDRILLFIFFSMPSVGVWSSVHSKESVGVFIMSILTAFLIKVNLESKTYPNIVEVIALFLCVLFKPQYLIALISVYVFVLISRRCCLAAIQQLVLAAVIIGFQTTILYYAQPTIDLVALQMYRHFDSATAQSTRENLFFAAGDFYRHAPYGMFISFFGPTIQEAANSPSKLLAFVESSVLVMIISYYIATMLKRIVQLKFNSHIFSLLFLTFFWLLFVHYPFGVFNPGSAIRYRTNFLPFIIGMILMCANYHQPSQREPSRLSN